MYNMNYESKRQELASRLVNREVIYCVSSLVSTLSALVQNVSYEVQRNEGILWEEDILPLLEWVDYEEALRAWVMDSSGTDVDSLERAVEMGGYWENVVDASGYTTYLSEFIPTPEQEEAFDFQEWLDADKERDEEFRELVFDRLVETSDIEELCRELNVDTDDYRNEVYEHWIVTRWMADKLGERGEAVGELFGIPIWGRCCTGQAISLDYTIQQMAIELWPEDYARLVGESNS